MTLWVSWQVEGLTSWLTGKETQQEKLEGHEDPAVHSSEVNSKLGEVRPLPPMLSLPKTL